MTRHVVRLEGRLALPSDRPLADLSFDVDPLDGIALACAQARPGEHVGVALGVLPVSHRALRRQAHRSRTVPGAHLLGGLVGDAAEVVGVAGLFGLDQRASRAARADRDPVEVSTERFEVREKASKLTAGGPVVAVQLLIRAEAPTVGRARHLAQEAAAGLAPWAGENRWVLRPVARPHHRSFDRRWRTGEFRPHHRQLVTLPEIAGLLRPPSKRCVAPVARSVTGLGAPDDLPAYGPGTPDVLPLGLVHRPTGPEMVGVRVEDTLFAALTGASGFGKTETALSWAIHLARTGRGVWYVDPHGDALDRMKPYLCERHVAARLVELNLAADQDVTPTWNLLSMAAEKALYGVSLTHPRVMDAMARKASAVVDSFAAAVGWNPTQNMRALNLATQAARSLLELSVALPDELAPTVFQMRHLLANDAWRQRVLPYLSADAQEFWQTTFDKLAGDAITPITNLVDFMRQSSAVVGLLGASDSTFDPRRAIDSGQVVLVCPDAGASANVSAVVANLFVYGLRSAVLGRKDQPVEQRTPVWAFLDEAQAYDNASAGTLAALLEQARKFGLHALIMSQSPKRLSEATRTALATNRSHLLTAGLRDPEGAALTAKQMGHGLDPTELLQLRKYHLVCSVLLRGDLTTPFPVEGVAVPVLWERCARPEHVGVLEGVARRNVQHLPVGVVAAHQATLADRIVRWLEANGSPTTSPNPSGRGRVRTA